MLADDDRHEKLAWMPFYILVPHYSDKASSLYFLHYGNYSLSIGHLLGCK